MERMAERAHGRQRQQRGWPGQPAPSLPGARATPAQPASGRGCLPQPRWAVCATGAGAHQGQTSREGEKDIWWTARTARGGTGHLGLTNTETQRSRTACGQRRVDSKNSQTTPATTSTFSIHQLLGAADAQRAHIQHSSNTPTTGLRERGNNTSKSTSRSGRQKAATRRNMRREERVTVRGPVKEQQPNGMSHRGPDHPTPWGRIRREGAPKAVRQAVGGGCQSGWGQLLSVTNAIEAGTCRQGTVAGRPGVCGGVPPPLPMHQGRAKSPPPHPTPPLHLQHVCVPGRGVLRELVFFFVEDRP